MFKFLFARHRNAYIKLGFKYLCWPEVPYNLAHGKNAKTAKHSQICHEMLKMKIIHRHHHSTNPDDYVM